MPVEVIIGLLTAALFVIAFMLIVIVVVLIKLTADVQKFARLLLKVCRWIKEQDKERKP